MFGRVNGSAGKFIAPRLNRAVWWHALGKLASGYTARFPSASPSTAPITGQSCNRPAVIAEGTTGRPTQSRRGGESPERVGARVRSATIVWSRWARS